MTDKTVVPNDQPSAHDALRKRLVRLTYDTIAGFYTPSEHADAVLQIIAESVEQMPRYDRQTRVTSPQSVESVVADWAAVHGDYTTSTAEFPLPADAAQVWPMARSRGHSRRRGHEPRLALWLFQSGGGYAMP